MDKYKVKLNSKAFRDIDEIFKYIALEKLSPENAQSKKTISSIPPKPHQNKELSSSKK